jgi:MerR family transcriptional regulator, copper efflux regulator
MSKMLKIGVVARRTGLSIDTIRFYEKQGLLKSPTRSQGGFRLYQPKDIEHLQLIRTGQSLGFSLEEIRDLLTLRTGRSTPCAEVKRLLEQKLRSVREKIGELAALEEEIGAALSECNQALRRAKSNDGATCPVLNVNRPVPARKK